ncbi:MAG: hypothetical protein HQL27_09230 [Candidatus Omnitrophica bacterium]|nr:hypothetical protein [Candidatus Omnitrophota bacterium]
MKRKTVIYVLIAIFVLWVAANAQEWPSTEHIVAKIQAELNLTKEQFAKVKIIIDENMAKRQKITPQLTQGLTQAQSAPLDSELYTNLSKVLTRAQMSQWNRILELLLQEDPSAQDAK